MRSGLTSGQVPVYVLTARMLRDGDVPQAAAGQRIFIEVINLEKLEGDAATAFARRRMMSLRHSSVLRDARTKPYLVMLCPDVLGHEELLLTACSSAIGRAPEEVLRHSA